MLKGSTSRAITPMRRSHDVGDGININEVLERSGVFYVLVPDILLNILSRVPLKSLSQCRWVCRSWYKLLKSPMFAKIQFEWAVNNTYCVLFWTYEKDFYLIDDQAFDNLETSVTPHNIKLTEFKLNFCKNDFQVVGYTNGLICIVVYRGDFYDCCASFFVCNPITGEHITIPKSPNRNKLKCLNDRYAFGFDPTTGVYKIVCIFHYVDEGKEYLSLEGEIYTLGSSEWRKMEDVPRFDKTGLCGVFVRGNIHWMSDLFDSIIAFDVGSEKFRKIQPPTPSMWQTDAKGLTVLDTHLCFLYNKAISEPYEMWVMKEYGVQSSWTMKYNFCTNWLKWVEVRPITVISLKNGGFLVLCDHPDTSMVIYNPKTKIARNIKMKRLEDSAFYMVMQAGSLLSPKDVGILRRGEEDAIQEGE